MSRDVFAAVESLLRDTGSKMQPVLEHLQKHWPMYAVVVVGTTTVTVVAFVCPAYGITLTGTVVRMKDAVLYGALSCVMLRCVARFNAWRTFVCSRAAAMCSGLTLHWVGCPAGYYSPHAPRVPCLSTQTHNPLPGSAAHLACSCPAGHTTFPAGTAVSDCAVSSITCPARTQPAVGGSSSSRSATDRAPVICGYGSQLNADHSGCTRISPGLHYSVSSMTCVACGQNQTCVGILDAPLTPSHAVRVAALPAQLSPSHVE
jgi:hypothetical protein